MFRNRLVTAAASALTAAAALGGMTVLTAAPANAATNYAALAFSPTGSYKGWAVNYPSKNAAISTALGYCAAGANGCVVAAWVQDGCVALALSDSRWAGGYGANTAIAQADALSKVPGGTISETRCTA